MENANQLKDWYAEGMGLDYRKELANPRFADIVQRMERPAEEGTELAARLEAKLEENNQRIESITNHPKQRLIVDIIQKMTNEKGWERYFPRISGKKAEVMLAKISDDAVKDNLFSIISLDKASIAQLGELAQDPNLNSLLSQARKLLQAGEEKKADFAFKKLIGVGIEDLIRTTLKSQLQGLRVEVVEQQNGQDITVWVGDVLVYQIEVKSRWQSSYSVTMSYRQLSEAVAHPDRYALCSVNLVDYWPEERDKRYEITDIAQIRERIRFVPTIGQQILPLVRELKAVEGDVDAVRLADEYRVVIPQRVVQQGLGLEEFVAYLAGMVRRAENG